MTDARKLAGEVKNYDKETLARFGLPLLKPDDKSGSKDRVKKFRGLIKRLDGVHGIFLNKAFIDVSDLSWKAIKGKGNKKAPIPRAYFQSIDKFWRSVVDVSSNASTSEISKYTNAAMGCTVQIRYEVPGAIYLVPYKRYGEGGR
ncbi:MAG TPA: hypothetical protein DCE47_08720 [Planctomycetaceae bacterium]|nr:hypothetical protein [Planctomycetaceae bacterium]